MKNKTIDSLVKFLICLLALLSLATIIFALAYILVGSRQALSFEFITSKPKGIPFGTRGGIFPALVGTLYLGILSILIAGPISLASALVLAFYKPGYKFLGLIDYSHYLGAGLPSILYGLIAYTVLIYKLGLSKSLLTASITIGILIVPFISLRLVKIFRESSTSLLATGLALGLSRDYIIRKIILRENFFEILSTLALGMSYGIGAVAPIMYTGVVINAGIPSSPRDPFMSLSYHLYTLATNGISASNTYATALVLLGLLALIQISFKTLAYLKERNNK